HLHGRMAAPRSRTASRMVAHHPLVPNTPRTLRPPKPPSEHVESPTDWLHPKIPKAESVHQSTVPARCVLPRRTRRPPCPITCARPAETPAHMRLVLGARPVQSG